MKNSYRIIITVFAFVLTVQFTSAQEAVKKVICKTDSSMIFEYKIKKDDLNQSITDLLKKKEDIKAQKRDDKTTAREIKKKVKDIDRKIESLENKLERINRKIHNAQRYVESNYFQNEKGTIRFIGDQKINNTEVLNANINQINGTLEVFGKVTGDIAVINGGLKISDSGSVGGKIILINSELIYDSTKNIQYSCADIDFKNIDISEERYSYFSFPRNHFPTIQGPTSGVFRFNRAEGLYFGLSSDKSYYWNSSKKSSFYSSFGYGFSNHRWQGSLGFDRWIGNYNRTEVGAEVYSKVDSKDNWLIDPTENTVYSFFIREDYKDYYLKEGWDVHLAQYIDRNTRVRVDYINDKYRSIEKNTDWALFGGDKTFRDNPMINDGTYKSIVASVNHSTVNSDKYILEGWNVQATYEKTTGPMDFQRAVLDVRRYQPLFDDQRINVRVIAGTADNILPVQKSFDLGGLGTIPAMSFKSLQNNNRLILANIEYLIGLDNVLETIFDEDFHFGNGNDFIVFYDMGNAFVDYSDNMFKGFEKVQMKQDVGFAFGFDKNAMRIGAAFRLDRSQDATFFFRFSRPF